MSCNIDNDCPDCLEYVRTALRGRCPKCAREGRPGNDFQVNHTRGGMPLPNDAHAELKCYDLRCGHHMWLPKPKGPREPAGADLVSKSGVTACQLCRIEIATIRWLGMGLHAHHVIEQREGGSDDPSNIWIVCSSCHALIHHERQYRGHYSRMRSAAATAGVAA